jgi:hypothetical protein
MASKSSESWEEIGEGAAAQMRTAPTKVEYIEARGPLCHELLFLLKGNIEFVKTPWREFVLKILEFQFPISPICRWHPPDNCVLERVGYNGEVDAEVYRLTPNEGPIVVFFVKYKPEPPVAGGYIRPLFNVPQLDIWHFLRPPFDDNNDNLKIENLLHSGIVEKFSIIPMTPEDKKKVSEIHLETCRGLWQGFTKK